MSHLLPYVIETFRNPGEPSANPVRARPMAGQGLPADLRVSCSTSMRDNEPVGSCLLLDARVVGHRTGTVYLYAKPNAPYRRVTREEAEQHIAQTFTAFR